MTSNFHVRQGDVLLIRVSDIADWTFPETRTLARRHTRTPAARSRGGGRTANS
jgi:hypothetical protein